MADSDRSCIRSIVAEFGGDRSRLMSIVQAVQLRFGCISDEALGEIASVLGIQPVQVHDMVSFYTFLCREPLGRIKIRLSNTPICMMQGGKDVAAAFEKTLGIRFGETTPDGRFTLLWTNDIGMCDQEPAALVNGTVLTCIRPKDVEDIVQALSYCTAECLLPEFPSFQVGISTIPSAVVRSSLIRSGPVLFAPVRLGFGLRAALNMAPEQVIEEVGKSRIRGRGGGGFPTATKWHLCRQARGETRFVICNADEGEPGTFKDRVLLTETPDLVLEGLTIAGYALGASEGIVYLRAEYAYLWNQLQKVLTDRRRMGLLGDNVCGSERFNFDIRMQLGAGAYVCGEETSLVESLEGKRGAPRDRPPYPADRGYMRQPTTINNVETLACITRILENGGEWFAGFGTRGSTGTKLMSVSGDCEHPGVYEVPLGTTVNELLDMAGGSEAEAVQVSGAAGQCVAPKDFGRQLSYEDLPTNGSTMVFGPNRDILDLARQFIEFFIEESCGWCTPCRVGTTLLHMQLDKILEGRGTLRDVAEMERLCDNLKKTSRCGLGQSAPNSILSTLRNFPQLYEQRLQPVDFIPVYEDSKALAEAVEVQGRESVMGASQDNG